MGVFKMPSLGADMEAGTLVEWKVKPGDRVGKGDVIAEVESDKGVIDVEVFEDGVVDKLLVTPGTRCAVGTPIAMIRSGDESSEQQALDEVTGQTASKKSETVPAEEKAKKVPAAEKTQTVSETKTANTPPAPAKEKQEAQHEVRISPAARKRAAELGVDLEALAGKIDGKIGVDAVEAAAAEARNAQREETPQEKTATKARTDEAVQQQPAEDAAVRSAGKTKVVNDAMRQAIARAMSRSNAEIPHYYLSTSVNMSPALAWLEKENAKRSIKERILPAALEIRAVVKALQAVPELNGFWKDDALQMSEAINPGIAIARRSGGLVTPALLNAQAMNLDETMAALRDLITRTRSGKLKSSEITEQTIVVTNLGDLGVERVYGVIYPPQVALVGFGRIVDAPWAEGDTLAVRKVMQATLAGDHRATDGRTGALFLDKLNQFLQQPEELL